ncbi:unnamed protein product, partial [marine sediment metagenome]
LDLLHQAIEDTLDRELVKGDLKAIVLLTVFRYNDIMSEEEEFEKFVDTQLEALVHNLYETTIDNIWGDFRFESENTISEEEVEGVIKSIEKLFPEVKKNFSYYRDRWGWAIPVGVASVGILAVGGIIAAPGAFAKAATGNNSLGATSFAPFTFNPSGISSDGSPTFAQNIQDFNSGIDQLGGALSQVASEEERFTPEKPAQAPAVPEGGTSTLAIDNIIVSASGSKSADKDTLAAIETPKPLEAKEGLTESTEANSEQIDATFAGDSSPPQIGLKIEGFQLLVPDRDGKLAPCQIRGVTVDENFTAQDISLLNQLGANTIRTYRPIEDKVLLDKLAEAGIRLIIGIPYDSGSGSSINIKDGNYIDYIEKYKDHAAILIWEFGNEYNYHPEWFGGNINVWYNALEQAAQKVHDIDSNHPVSTAHGELPSLEVLEKCPSVDIWGLNVYRWDSPAGVFTEWQELCEQLGRQIPVYLSESGADSYDSKADIENQEAQAQANLRIW